MVKGFPVVISDRGAPFIAVEKNAPLATVATNGLGLPIRIVDKNAPPLIIDGMNINYAWTMIAGGGNGIFGYHKYSDMGNLTGPRLAGETVTEIITAGENPTQLEFVIDGNVMDKIAGKSIYINDYPPIKVTWQYDSNSNTTHISSTDVDFTFASGESYKIEIK